MLRIVLAACAVLFAVQTAAHAQTAAPAQAAAPASNTPTPTVLIQESANSKDVFSFDYAVPSSPALSLLGLDASKVSQSNSLRPFVLSLPSVLGGEDGQAIAIDASTGWMFDPGERTFTAYADGSEWYRRLRRTRMGLAVYEGVEDAANPSKNIGSRLAVGFSTSWLDDSDPLMARLPGSTSRESAWTLCLDAAGPAVQRALEAPLPGTLPEAEADRLLAERERVLARKRAAERELQTAQSLGDTARIERLSAEIAQAETQLVTIAAIFSGQTEAAQTALRESYGRSEASSQVGRCAARADRAARLSRDFDIGVGAIMRGEPGQISDFDSAGSAIWLSYRHPFGVDAADMDTTKPGSWWMVGGALRAGFEEYVSTGNNATPEIQADTLDAWIGFEQMTDSRRLSLQLGYQEREPTADFPTFERDRTRYLVSWAQRLGDRESSIWLNVSYGHANGNGAFEDDEALLVSLLYAPPAARRIFGAP
jgi:hypothetical protein